MQGHQGLALVVDGVDNVLQWLGMAAVAACYQLAAAWWLAAGVADEIGGRWERDRAEFEPDPHPFGEPGTVTNSCPPHTKI